MIGYFKTSDVQIFNQFLIYRRVIFLSFKITEKSEFQIKSERFKIKPFKLRKSRLGITTITMTVKIFLFRSYLSLKKIKIHRQLSIISSIHNTNQFYYYRRFPTRAPSVTWYGQTPKTWTVGPPPPEGLVGFLAPGIHTHIHIIIHTHTHTLYLNSGYVP